MLRRRAVLGLLLASSLPMSVGAQTRPRICILHSGFPLRTAIHVMIEALGKLGYADGRTATIEILGGEGNAERLAALVASLVTQKPDLIIAVTSPAALALKQGGVTTPVVFSFVPDPIGIGVVESLARPGGNFTGVTYSDTMLGGKRLELLADAVPGCKRVAVLWSRQLPESAAIVDSIGASAVTRGITVYARELRGLADLGPAFDDAVHEGVQAVIFMADNVMFGYRQQTAAVALAHRLPTMHSFSAEVLDGGMMFYGPSADENYWRAAALAARVLKGGRPAEIPVEQPTKFELIINQKTAAQLGLTLPPLLLALADQLVE
jgi:putative ABC transport system substrate-binding protein